nr:MAG TPA: hypothetical protein [Caudoviricetes sp.]
MCKSYNGYCVLFGIIFLNLQVFFADMPKIIVNFLCFGLTI